MPAMATSTPLTEAQLAEALTALPGWRIENDRLVRTYKFGSFKDALSFIVRLGLDAEAQQHHPEICNVYNSVRISLCTHDAGDRITEKDVTLARTIVDFAGA